jgi:transposase-like protein
MPWKLETPMSQRKEFVSLAQTDGANVARLCRRFEVSRKIGYKWLARYREAGESGLADRSRRPHHSPRETQEALVAAVLAVRAAHPRPGAAARFGPACWPRAGCRCPRPAPSPPFCTATA